jgi:hypothetical protein
MSLFADSLPSSVTLSNPVNVYLDLEDEPVGTMILMPGTYLVSDYKNNDNGDGYVKVFLPYADDSVDLTGTAFLEYVVDAVYHYGTI